MKKITDFFRQGVVSPVSLLLMSVFGLIAVGSILANTMSSIPEVNIRTEPQTGILTIGELFEVQLIVTSSIPVNAFQGMLTFDKETLAVQSINYNTSIADLWVEDPWYSNGEGTIYFAGGTTKKGGFIGSGTLITITFKSLTAGNSYIGIENARILKHDGLGTDATVESSIDSVFTVNAQNSRDVLRLKNKRSTSVAIQTEPPTTDLNGDGKQNLADISIFMLHLAQKNKRSDFNQDGVVNLSDMSIIMNIK